MGSRRELPQAWTQRARDHSNVAPYPLARRTVALDGGRYSDLVARRHLPLRHSAGLERTSPVSPRNTCAVVQDLRVVGRLGVTVVGALAGRQSSRASVSPADKGKPAGGDPGFREWAAKRGRRGPLKRSDFGGVKERRAGISVTDARRKRDAQAVCCPPYFSTVRRPTTAATPTAHRPQALAALPIALADAGAHVPALRVPAVSARNDVFLADCARHTV